MESSKKQLFLLIFAGLLLFSISISGQGLKDSLVLKLDKWNGQFSKGDTIKVYSQSLSEKTVEMNIYTNGILSSIDTIIIAEGASIIYSSVYDKPTSIIIRLSALNDKNDRTEIGYIVDAGGFKPGFETPKDLRKFWKRQFRTLHRSTMRVNFNKVDAPVKYGEKYLCYDLEISMPEGMPVRGYMAYPKDAKIKSLPIVIFAHGAGDLTQKWAQSQIYRAIDYAMRGNGALVVDINAHGMLNGQPSEYYENLQKGELKGYSRRTVTDHESFYFRTMFLRMKRLLDYLCKSKLWDRERVLLIGSSQGAAQAGFLASTDKRVKAAVLTVPAMMDLGAKLDGRKGSWPQLLESQGINSPAAKIVPYYDTALLLKGCKAKLYFEAGLIDMSCPPACVFAGYNAASGDKQIHTYPYRSHSQLTGAHLKEWEAKVNNNMNLFIDNYLK
jgi:cephalosporin-C deacetylase-like acetyl esterase